MKRIAFLSCIIGVIIFSSCKGPYRATTPTGVDAIVNFTSDSQLKGELLFMAADTVYLLSNRTLYAFNLDKVNSTRLIGVEMKNRDPILVGTGIAGGVLAGLFYEDNNWEWGTVSMGLSLWAIISGFTGNQKYIIKAPFTEESKFRIKLHCRYPQGLNNDLYNQIVSYYTEKKPLIILD